MFSLTDSIRNEARLLAREMMNSGVSITPICSGEGAEIACVSSNEELVHWLEKFEENGMVFFIGHRKAVR